VPYGGIDSSTVNYANALAAQGHEVHAVATKAAPGCDFMEGGVFVHNRPIHFTRVASRLMPGWPESMQLAWGLLQLHRQFHFDMIEIPNWEGLGAMPALMGLPIAIRHHTSTEDSLRAQGVPMSFLQTSLARLESLSSRWARANIVHNQYHARKVSARGDLRGISVIPHVLPGECREARSTAPCPVVLSVGSLMARKGSDIMLAAAEIFLKQLPGWKLHLVGTDAGCQYEEKFRQRAAPEIVARVVFEGFLGEELLNDRYRDSDIYLTTSLFESFGLPCLEAMKRGKPLVATNAGALPELVHHGVNGFLCEPGDAAGFAAHVVRLAEDEVLRREMGLKSLALAEQHSDMEDVCRKYQKIPLSLGWKSMRKSFAEKFSSYMEPHLTGLPPSVYTGLRWPLKSTRPFTRKKLALSSRARGLGDELMCTAVFRAIKSANPDCAISFYARYPLLHQGNPDLEQVLPEHESQTNANCITLRYDVQIPLPVGRTLLCSLGLAVGLADVAPILRPPQALPLNAETEAALTGIGPFVCVQPRASSWTRNKDWPVEHWQALVDVLVAGGCRVVEVGDTPLGLISKDPELFVSLAGKTDVGSYMEVIRKAAVFVGPPSSGMHLASAFQVPAVIIFGGYEHPLGHDYPLQTSFYTPLSCSPCWLKTECPYGRICLAQISPVEVGKSVFEKLNSSMASMAVCDAAGDGLRP
jgi:glycosyltransferase involved in cell wall biosynthesis/ADP-heptose:LPS heptosyltransferase